MGFALCLLVFNNLALDHLVCGMWADGIWHAFKEIIGKRKKKVLGIT
jgi:hypothetical protein